MICRASPVGSTCLPTRWVMLFPACHVESSIVAAHAPYWVATNAAWRDTRRGKPCLRKGCFPMSSLFKSRDNAFGHKQYQETMPKLGLDLNTRVFVRLNPLNRRSVPLQGEFLGISHYDFLILRLPSIPGLVKNLLPSTRVEIRYLTEGAVNTFTTEIISHSFKPTLILYTTYPDRMSILETRKHQRVSCALPITLTTPHGDALGVVWDLSMGGCRIAVELKGQSNLRQLVADETVVLQTVLSSDGTTSRGIALVRNVEVTGSRLTLGLSFDENNKSFVEALAGYLNLVQVLD